jgi:hypothetical protein
MNSLSRIARDISSYWHKSPEFGQIFSIVRFLPVASEIAVPPRANWTRQMSLRWTHRNCSALPQSWVILCTMRLSQARRGVRDLLSFTLSVSLISFPPGQRRPQQHEQQEQRPQAKLEARAVRRYG